jgi:sulfatase maturation enzyme AslB (radical SAM superfamily)
LKFYPETKGEKIKVIYHGFEPELFQKEISKEKIEEINTKYQIPNTKYYSTTVPPKISKA